MFTYYETINVFNILFISDTVLACIETGTQKNKTSLPIYKDVPYLQDYAVKYVLGDKNAELKKVYTDRNGVVQVLASNGLYRPSNGHFQYPGTLKSDKTYRRMSVLS